MKNSNKQRLFEVMSKVNSDFKPKLNEELAVASDGGYYNKPTNKVYVSKQEATQIKQITDTMYNELFSKNGVTKIGRNDSLKQEIIQDLKKNGIQMDYDGNQNEDFYWITNESDIEPAKEEFKLIVSNLYDGINDEQPMDETRRMFNVNPKYTHFAILKNGGKIVNGWEYKGYDPEELRLDKNHYFFNDIRDMQINPKLVNIVTGKYLERKGINPYDYNNWYNIDSNEDDIYTL